MPCAGEAPIPLWGNNPAMVPAIVAAIPGLPLPVADLGTPPAGQRKLFSRARPRRPKGLSLILSPVRRDLAEAARLLLISTLVGRLKIDARVCRAQVLTFGMSSQRVV